MRLRKAEAMKGEAAGVGIVVSGVVEVQTVLASGDRHAASLSYPGSLLGLHQSFLPSAPADHHQLWRARTEAQLLCIPRASFMACFWDDPAMSAGLLERLSEGINLLLDELACATLLDARGKVARRLLVLEAASADPLQAGSPAARVSQSDLARMLGLSRQSVNAVLGEFQDAGLVRVHRFKIEVLSRQGLREVLDETLPARAESVGRR